MYAPSVVIALVVAVVIRHQKSLFIHSLTLLLILVQRHTQLLGQLHLVQVVETQPRLLDLFCGGLTG